MDEHLFEKMPKDVEPLVKFMNVSKVSRFDLFLFKLLT
jgi:hypothetical protein